MNSDNRDKLRGKVVRAAAAALARQGYVSAIDVLTGIGWLNPADLKRWRQGQTPYLGRGIQTNLSRISEAMRLFRAWATSTHLNPSETAYVAKTPSRPQLRFSASGEATIERMYRTHWGARDLSPKKSQRIEEKANRPPDLVLIQPLDTGWRCHRCAGTGDLLIMEEPGPSCLACAGLGSLVFLPAGDAALTRRAKVKSAQHAAVVRFSKSRKRYERQGLLVETDALREAEKEVGPRALCSPLITDRAMAHPLSAGGTTMSARRTM